MTENAEIRWEFNFEAAHRLPNVPSDHKCSRLHGHSYTARVYVTGPIDERAGWIIDFANIKDACKPVIARLDHYYLTEIPGLENPTSENIAIWIWDRLALTLSGLTKVVVRETCTSGCVYEGPAASA
jgi:6-pyruvoyltetrahydropterin/6-carboxytetrahydropterin synthase